MLSSRPPSSTVSIAFLAGSHSSEGISGKSTTNGAGYRMGYVPTRIINGLECYDGPISGGQGLDPVANGPIAPRLRHKSHPKPRMGGRVTAARRFRGRQIGRASGREVV